jgi:hypothetical protein
MLLWVPLIIISVAMVGRISIKERVAALPCHPLAVGHETVNPLSNYV